MQSRRNYGMIIRLVDVVLIVLFGFLMISKIQQQVDIPLPHSKGVNRPVQLDEEVLDVYVRRDGRIQVGWLDSGYQVVMPLRNEDEELARRRYEDLKALVAEANPDGRPVAIKAEYDAPTQYTVDMLDVCKDLNMPKSITCFGLPGAGAAAGAGS
ncbi:MAG: biopolymer transporter ExbD [Candidatus Krumholzibacteriia bacterium]